MLLIAHAIPFFCICANLLLVHRPVAASLFGTDILDEILSLQLFQISCYGTFGNIGFFNDFIQFAVSVK